VAGLGETAELGLSVLNGSRGKGLGDALFARAVTFLRNRGAREVMVHCLSENAAMMHLASKHHMRVDREGGEADARLELLPATMDSYVTEWLTDQQAEALQAIRHQGIFARAVLKLR
jgi:RimJ/RimL family protein N-acetyltransferase